MDNKLKDCLLKLLALTESKNQHEAASAQSRIEKLCKVHGVSIDDLVDVNEAIEIYWFKYKTHLCKTVLIQTVWKVTNIGTTWNNKRRKGQVGVKCTKSQAAEIELWWSVLQRAFLLQMNEHLEIFTHAFVKTNNLYGVWEDDEEPRQLSEAELEKHRKAAMLAGNMEPTAVHLRLEEL